MEQALELIVGVSFLIVGLSVLFNQKEWINFIDYDEKKGSWVVIVVGIADLLFGSFIMAFHWVWNGIGVITIIGAILFLRGVIHLLFPRWLIGGLYE